MASNESPRCDRCGGIMKYGGNISLPPHDIYSCGSCRKIMLVARGPRHALPQSQQQQELEE